MSKPVFNDSYQRLYHASYFGGKPVFNSSYQNLYHFGILGMKWGRKKVPEQGWVSDSCWREKIFRQ